MPPLDMAERCCPWHAVFARLKPGVTIERAASELTVIARRISARHPSAPRVARVIRGATQGISTKEYVLAAQARGERSLPIVLREILPNIAPTVFVEFAVRLVYVILFITTLNFLGLGLHPPAPNWGLMVAESRAELTTNPVAALAPTVAIGALAIAIGLVADAVTQTFGIDRPDRLLR